MASARGALTTFDTSADSADEWLQRIMASPQVPPTSSEFDEAQEVAAELANVRAIGRSLRSLVERMERRWTEARITLTDEEAERLRSRGIAPDSLVERIEWAR